MAIDPNQGSLQSLRLADEGLLFFKNVDPTLSGDLTLHPIDDLNMKSAGPISTDGVLDNDNEEAGESIPQKGGRAFIVGAGTSAPTLQVTIWGRYNPDALELVVHPDDITKNVGGKLTKVNYGSGKKPVNKTFSMETETIGGDPVRRVYWQGIYASKEKVGGSDEEPEGWTVTYSLLPGGPDSVTSTDFVEPLV